MPSAASDKPPSTHNPASVLLVRSGYTPDFAIWRPYPVLHLDCGIKSATGRMFVLLILCLPYPLGLRQGTLPRLRSVGG